MITNTHLSISTSAKIKLQKMPIALLKKQLGELRTELLQLPDALVIRPSEAVLSAEIELPQETNLEQCSLQDICELVANKGIEMSTVKIEPYIHNCCDASEEFDPSEVKLRIVTTDAGTVEEENKKIFAAWQKQKEEREHKNKALFDQRQELQQQIDTLKEKIVQAEQDLNNSNFEASAIADAIQQQLKNFREQSVDADLQIVDSKMFIRFKPNQTFPKVLRVLDFGFEIHIVNANI